ncbi:hypothetical protein D0T84_07775 [Dysgonomonas sp. 521]|uniref:glycosyl hydrolase n=1 Tax=Dysgonomonas sp. 521 TaxID=2302932 RepID=UPI0013D1BD17|nr:glycosyl hydrolase [Dysgonomonas sp. 521]NDV94818.1 hypothetical protein [Dysgonomonas sp. 521]
MKKILCSLSYFLMGVLLMTACTDVDDPVITQPEAPQLVSSSPEDGATGISESGVTIVLTYDQNIFCPSAGHEKITLGDATITSVAFKLTQVTINATGLKKGQTYQLVVPEGVVQGPTYIGAPEVSISFTVKADPVITASLCNPNATAQAVKVYKYLVETYKSKTISGTMANVNWNVEGAEAVYKLTGKYPAMNTFDYVHLPFSPNSWIDYSDISPVKNWWDAGGLVSIMWHWNVPAVYYGEASSIKIWPSGVFMPDNWSGSVQLTDNTLFASAKVGDKVKVVTSNVLAGAQGSIKGNDWEKIADGYEYFDISGDYDMEITADILAKLQSGGMIISGHDYTVDEVILQSGNSSARVWPELVNTGGWANTVQLTDGSLFADVSVGNKIKITTSDVESGAQGSLKTGADGWPAIADGYEYFDITGDFELVVTDEIKAALQATGLIIGGQKYSITGVSVEAGGYSDNYAFYKDQTSFDAANATVAGTWENEVFNADLAKVATSLKQLQDAGVAVIWRPFHEAAGGWFWWGKDAESCKKLWIAMFDYFQAQGVNNLIWVWTSEPDDNAWYPGDNYVDIIGRDLYDKDANESTSAYLNEFGRYGHKVIALTEMGTVGLLSEQWAAGARWAWFMPWYGTTDSGDKHATDAWWTDAMSQDFVVTRDQLPSFK